MKSMPPYKAIPSDSDGRDSCDRQRNPIRAFDLFCGAGGSSMGASKAGAQIVGGVERWHLAAQTFVDNFPGVTLFQRDIRNLSATSVASTLGPIDLLLASPECTNHTIAKGKRKRGRDSEASRRTAYEVIRFAKAMRPRWIVVENVIQMKRWSQYGQWRATLQGMGYKVSEQVLDAADFGVRQSRRRLFIICDKEMQPREVRLGKRRQRPVRPLLSMNGKYPFSLLKTVKRAKATIDRAHRGIAHVGRRRPFLIVYYSTDGAGGWQPLGVPLRTVTTVDRFALVKWDRSRYRMRMLQLPELKRAMGFPASFRMRHGVRRDQIAMLGNGVCPPVMREIVLSLTRTNRSQNRRNMRSVGMTAEAVDRRLSTGTPR